MADAQSRISKAGIMRRYHGRLFTDFLCVDIGMREIMINERIP